jgi:hypothetical protein
LGARRRHGRDIHFAPLKTMQPALGRVANLLRRVIGFCD